MITIYNEEFPKGFALDLNLEPMLPDFAPNTVVVDRIVGKGEIFVIGDNHNASKDSRLFGNIKLENVSGRLLVRIWPITNFKLFGQ